MNMTILAAMAATLMLAGCQLQPQRGVLPTGTGQTSSGGLVPGQMPH